MKTTQRPQAIEDAAKVASEAIDALNSVETILGSMRAEYLFALATRSPEFVTSALRADVERLEADYAAAQAADKAAHAAFMATL